MPFTDPMADGPAVQAAGLRALKAGQTLRATLDDGRGLSRRATPDTPLVLMGYFNPIYVYGVEPFLRDARLAGVDGLIVVDCPPEEDDELCEPGAEGRDWPSSASRPRRRTTLVFRPCSPNAGGFVYYVSITGVTGVRDARSRGGRASGRADQATHVPAGRRRVRGQGRGERRGHRRRRPTASSSVRLSSKQCAVRSIDGVGQLLRRFRRSPAWSKILRGRAEPAASAVSTIEKDRP